MKIFILIAWIHVGYGSHMISQEFSSEEKCDKAGGELMLTLDLFSNGKYICMEK